MRIVMLCILAVAFTACEKRSQSVWELYDVSHPLPTTSKVREAEGIPKKVILYEDNDTYYKPPKTNTNICNSGPFGTMGCE